MSKHLYATLPVTYEVGGTADSTDETVFHATGVDTTWSGGYILVPAESTRVGDFYDGTVCIDVTAQNSTDTLDLAVYFGPITDPTTGIKIADYAALDAATTAKGIKYWCAIEAIGAGSTARISGLGLSWNTAATALSQTIANTGVDAQVSTFADMCFAVTATWSVSDAGNMARLRSHHCIKHPANPSV